MKNDQKLDFFVVSDLIDYESSTGDLIWKKDVARTAKKGSLAGIQRSDGYKRLKICGKSVYAHRLAWMIFYGYAYARMYLPLLFSRNSNPPSLP